MTDYETLMAGIDALASMGGTLSVRKDRQSAAQRFLANVIPAQIAILRAESRFLHVWKQTTPKTLTCSCGEISHHTLRDQPACPQLARSLQLAYAAIDG